MVINVKKVFKKNTFYEERELSHIIVIQEKDNKKIVSELFTKTPPANFLIYYFQQIRVSLLGRVPSRSSQLFQASGQRQFLHITFLVLQDKDWG